jgi:chorismate mutase/prephenate dehydratase
MSTTVPAKDPLVVTLREQISALDRELLELVNERLRLVSNLWHYKRLRGLPLVAPEREQALLDELTRANSGPLSSEGLAALHRFLLDLTKKEVAEDG